MPASPRKAGKPRAVPLRAPARKKKTAARRAAKIAASAAGRLTDHFSLPELTFSSTAVRLGIDNSPSDEIVAHLRVLARGLERVRALLGHPMHIDSGYRCEALNAAVNGSKTSAHMQGYAADFICPAYGDPLRIVQAITRSSLAFDQCIQEGTWVHISFDPRMRKEVLTAHFGAGGTTYTAGA
jgi:zinc D-Ala-D-Ala carboxypeptidase